MHMIPRNRLTQLTENGIKTTYSYDNNGNLIAESDGTQYLYDAFNRQVETYPDGTWQKNIYDATGLRMATIENGIYTEYTFDRGSVIADFDNNENRTTRYIRGYDLISQKDSEGNKSYYLHNAHGDVTKLVGINGSIKNSYSYDAFGNTTTYTEQVENRFCYSGEQYDAVTDQYYLRARYYEPLKGRFINEDTYGGQIENPLSLNLYSYCYNCPLNYIDPSGNKPGEAFNSADDAAKDFAENYNFPSVQNGVEYASFIFKVSVPVMVMTNDGVIPSLVPTQITYYTYNEPLPGTSTFSIPNPLGIAPPFINPVATIHTHGEYLAVLRQGNDVFSKESDISGSEFFGITIYMVNPKGELLKYDPYTDVTNTITSDVYFDINHPEKAYSVNDICKV